MIEKKEKPIVIELYELWNSFKARFDIVSPQPKSFTLNKVVHPVTCLDGPNIKFLVLSDDTEVAATTGVVHMLLQPPVGFIYKVLNISIGISVPSGGSSGTHEMYIAYTDGTNISPIAYMTSAFGAVIQASVNAASAGMFIAGAEHPDDPTAQHDILTKSIMCSHDCYVDFKYSNKTDAAQTGTRTLIIVVAQIPEGVY